MKTYTSKQSAPSIVVEQDSDVRAWLQQAAFNQVSHSVYALLLEQSKVKLTLTLRQFDETHLRMKYLNVEVSAEVDDVESE